MDPHAAMDAHAELAQIHTRQAERAAAATNLIALAGAVASFTGAIVAAFSVDDGIGTFAFLTTLGGGTVLTAALYAVVGALQAQAKAASVRHAALAGDDADNPTSALP